MHFVTHCPHAHAQAALDVSASAAKVLDARRVALERENIELCAKVVAVEQANRFYSAFGILSVAIALATLYARVKRR
jgi:hypothetical protein